MEAATMSTARSRQMTHQRQTDSKSELGSPRDAHLAALERRVIELERLTDSQSHDLRIQFERIAQLQAECDILRIRFVKP
jgi:hypothetical protein